MTAAERIDGIRLQRVLAQAGIGSRRACEEIIAAGRVEVNGDLVQVQGRRVDPAADVIRVDGTRVSTAPGLVYLALNKPRGMLSTMADERGRPCVGDVLSRRTERLYHVGRLDAETEGLLLLTNDGELSHRLMHPSYEVAKTYVAEIVGPLPRDVGKQLRAGIELDDGTARADKFRVLSSLGSRMMVEIVLHEGRHHVVRRMMAAVGHPVQRLVRVEVGGVALGDLQPGKLRHLGRDEVGLLFRGVGL